MTTASESYSCSVFGDITMAERNRPLGLRSGAVKAPDAPGNRAALTNGERVRKVLNQLLRALPVKQFILVPRSHAEAHRRADSMCVLLGMPFRILGPLLFAAAVLVVPKRGGGLGFSEQGFQTLVHLYNRTPSHGLVSLRKSLSMQAIGHDVRFSGEPVTRTFFYIYRGQKVPQYSYQALVADDLVKEKNDSDGTAEELSRAIFESLPAAVSNLFKTETVANELTNHLRSISVDTSSQSENRAAPSLITPTEEQQLPMSPSAVSVERSSLELPLQQRILHSPPNRTPGRSPPFQRLRRSVAAHPFRLEEEHSFVVETVDEDEEEEEKKEDEEPPPPAQVTIDDEIKASKMLDFTSRANGLRPPRKPTSKPIHVGNQRQATEAMRTKIVWLADQWGYAAASKKYEKLAIAEAASRVVFYDCGFAVPPKGTMVESWIYELERARHSIDANFDTALSNEKLGSQQGSYCTQIEAAFPGYIHELYRKVGRDPHVTYRATFAELADAMNKLSLTDANGRPPLHLTRATLKVWFNAWNGKVRKGWERPILTPERMAARVQWCKDRKAELKAAEDAGANSYHQRYYCFLDEKWFYIRSRRKKLKVLPRGPHEAEGADEIPMERESSRRHATKVMYLGVIADPVEEHGFDGKIYMQRVSRMKKLIRSKCSTKIIDDLAANEALHRQWHSFVERNMDAEAMRTTVGTLFDIDSDMLPRLCMRIKDHDGNNKVKWKTFVSFQKNRTIKASAGEARRPLQIEDLVLQVKYSKGEELPEDVSCDSEFMRANMDSIGKAIREKYHWVPDNDEIFLVMDNAGGHGTRDTIEKYVDDLLEDHKVRVLWQEPRGPELNLLDLGAWMSLQSAVEKHFRGNRNDAEVLARKIEAVWSSFDSAVFRKIWKRWILALDLVIADGGNNRLVNEHRGELFTGAAPPQNDDAAQPPADDYDHTPDDNEDEEFPVT